MSTVQFVTLPKDELIQALESVVLKTLQQVLKIGQQPEKEKGRDLYTREEVKELLKVSYPTLFNWNNKKILTAKKIGHRVYYVRADVQALLTK